MPNTVTGSLVGGVHAQSTKLLPKTFTLAPGTSAPVTLSSTAGCGSGGAHHYESHFALRTMNVCACESDSPESK
ncbi:hypothetical protein ACFRDV_43350 [Streptomyces fagopyri]|uniref:hypothetical protein n=1 Tax=Streptomyces fagopyri TaxID=2662397 RepID=UPI003695ACE3